jgi:hypothetical protein
MEDARRIMHEKIVIICFSEIPQFEAVGLNEKRRMLLILRRKGKRR